MAEEPFGISVCQKDSAPSGVFNMAPRTLPANLLWSSEDGKRGALFI